MEVQTEVQSTGSAIIERYAIAMNRSFPEALRTAARGVIRYVVRITPPFQADGGPDAPTSPAFQRGKRAVSRDLRAIFVPVRIKHKRPEVVSGAEMLAIHRRHLIVKAPGKRMKRDRPQPYFVDTQKFGALETKLLSHVGRMAAGWMDAVGALGVRGTPAWISRHGTGRGSVTQHLDGSDLWIEATNFAPNVPPAIVSEAQRRVPYAVRYQANAMQRGIMGYLSRKATESGLASYISAGAPSQPEAA